MNGENDKTAFFFLVIIIFGLFVRFILDGNVTEKYNKLNEDYENLEAEYDLLNEKYNSLEDDLSTVWCYFNEDASYDDAHESVNRLNDIYYGR